MREILFVIFFHLFVFFKTWVLCVALAVLDLAVWTKKTHRDLPAYASQLLGLKVCTTSTQRKILFLEEKNLEALKYYLKG